MNLQQRISVLAVAVVATVSIVSSLSAQGLQPVPVPDENPITESKRVLGKLLFWEEQLSSDNTIACGTCHRHETGSADPRMEIHPGPDGFVGTDDDIKGSPGVARRDVNGYPIEDDIFGMAVQVTGRTSPGFTGSLWSPDLFWDGRATSEFLDPETGEVVIAEGGALESQAVGPLMSDVEMAHENRNWDDVRNKLENATPMALATDLPADMAAALEDEPSYGDLFNAAFGTPDITASRIGMAIATYERTLVPDQTPWDLGTMTEDQSQGFQVFEMHTCGNCHAAPEFTDHSFRTIGLRNPNDDTGRFGVTQDPADLGAFKVPSLRNVGLRERLMHTGHIENVADAIRFYRQIDGHTHFTENQDELIEGGIFLMDHGVDLIIDFLENALTDPRAAAGEFPFDRPTLASEESTSVPAVLPESMGLKSYPNPFQSSTTINYTADAAGPVELAVYNIRGQLVRRIVADGAGVNAGSFKWDGRNTVGQNVPVGAYFVHVTTRKNTSAIKIVHMN